MRLEPNADILKELGQRKDGKLLVGFAAETGNLDANAERKLREKNLDMIVANDVTKQGSGFDGDTNIVTIIDCRGTTRSLPLMSKDEVADQIFDHLLTLKHLTHRPGIKPLVIKDPVLIRSARSADRLPSALASERFCH